MYDGSGYTLRYLCFCMYALAIYICLNIYIYVCVYAYFITYTFDMGMHTHMYIDLFMTFEKHKGYLRPIKSFTSLSISTKGPDLLITYYSLTLIRYWYL